MCCQNFLVCISFLFWYGILSLTKMFFYLSTCLITIRSWQTGRCLVYNSNHLTCRIHWSQSHISSPGSPETELNLFPCNMSHARCSLLRKESLTGTIPRIMSEQHEYIYVRLGSQMLFCSFCTFHTEKMSVLTLAVLSLHCNSSSESQLWVRIPTCRKENPQEGVLCVLHVSETPTLVNPCPGSSASGAQGSNSAHPKKSLS